MNNSIWQKQMSFNEILSEGFRLIRLNLITISLLVFCIHAPFNLIRTVLSSVTPVEKYDDANYKLFVSGIKWMDSFAGLIVVIGITHILDRSLQEETVSFGKVLQFSLSRFGNVLGTSILLSFITLGATLLFIIPGIIWGNYYSFAITIAAIRNMNGKVALDYSRDLIYGKWWKVFGITTGVYISAVFINFLILLLSRQVSEIKFLYVFAPLTFFNFVGAIVIVMGSVLFLNTEYIYVLKRQNNG